MGIQGLVPLAQRRRIHQRERRFARSARVRHEALDFLHRFLQLGRVIAVVADPERSHRLPQHDLLIFENYTELGLLLRV